MATQHDTHFCDASNMHHLDGDGVNLVVTSPMYPMIEMWDAIFAQQNPEIQVMIEAGDGWGAFEAMHQLLDETWTECYRVVSGANVGVKKT